MLGRAVVEEVELRVEVRLGEAGRGDHRGGLVHVDQVLDLGTVGPRVRAEAVVGVGHDRGVLVGVRVWVWVGNTVFAWAS